MKRKYKEPIDPSKTMAYNHYKIDGEKPVISNQVFKDTVNSGNAELMKEVLSIYACDHTQKHLLNAKILSLTK